MRDGMLGCHYHDEFEWEKHEQKGKGFECAKIAVRVT